MRAATTFPDISFFFCDKRSMRYVLPVAVALTAPVVAQCPANSAPHFDCLSAGGNTRITLFADAELSWDGFDVPSTGSLDILSSGGTFASRHLVTGFGRANIAGPITADGPFTLIAPGFNMSAQGSISAPSIILSALPPLDERSYQGSTFARQFVNNGTLTATSGDLTLLSYQLTNNGTLAAPFGKITLISTGSETISGPNFQRAPGDTLNEPLARSTNRGQIAAPVIEIYSEGFIQNGGRIAGDRVSLEAQGIVHNNAPGSFIITPDLTLMPDVLLEGTVLDPADGSNPGGISTTLGFPDLASGSFVGKRKTKLLPTQFSSSTVSRSRVPSAVSKRATIPSNSRLATRGSAKKKTVAKKRSFFGTVISK